MRFSRDIFLLILILLLALALRLHHLTRDSFWLDEIQTVQLSSGRGCAHLDFPQDELIPPTVDPFDLQSSPPIWSIWTSLDREFHPPLFYMVLRIWREVVGDSDFRIRLLSVVLSLVAIVMLYLALSSSGDTSQTVMLSEAKHLQPSLTRRMTTPRTTGLWACLLMALAGPQIEYAQEMRSYMLLLIGLLITASGILRVDRTGISRIHSICIASGAIIALLTHYAAIPALAAMVVYVIIRFRGKQLQHTLLAMGTAAIIFAITWGPIVIRQLHGVWERAAYTAQLDESRLMPLLRAAELPRRFLTEAAVRPAWFAPLAALLYVIPVLMLRRQPRLLFWWVWVVGYVSFITLVDVARNGHVLEWIRYTLAASPPVYVLVAGMLGHLSGWKRHIVPAALAVACLAALPAAYTRHKADWRELGEFFASRASTDDVMLFYSAHENEWQARTMYICLRYYAPEPAMPVAFVSQISPQIRQQLINRDIWVIGVGPDLPAERLLPGSRVVEMKFVPYAGTAALVRLDNRDPE